MNTIKPSPTPIQNQDDNFFLPDFCSVQTLLMMVLVAELMVLVLELYSKGFGGFTWINLGTSSFFVQWLTLLSAGLLCNMRGFLQRMPMRAGAFVSYLLIVLLSLIFSLLSDWFLQVRNGLQWNINQIASNVAICAVLAGIAMRYLYLQQQLRVQQQAELRARIDALQARIRPHFLFNSMNIIASLIEVDPETAERVVEDLSDLFRASLEAKNTEVDFVDELNLCKKYVGIEKLRLGDRLQVNWQLTAIPMDLKIPSLVLQPLLENAIYHGIQPLPQGGTVSVTGKFDGGRCEIRVVNPLPSDFTTDNNTQTPVERNGNRIAVENIRNRVYALYGPEAYLTLDNDKQRFVVTLSYPANYSGAVESNGDITQTSTKAKAVVQ